MANTKSAVITRADPTRAAYGVRMLQTSPFTQKPNTDFLGTPPNHDEMNKKRPTSPHLIGLDGKPHYAFPLAAIASITTRITGVMLSLGMAGMGAVAITGDVSAVVEGLKSYPILVPPTKFIIAYPFVYHTFAGLRHMWWDKTCKGLNSDALKTSSIALFGSSFAVSGVLAVASLPPL